MHDVVKRGGCETFVIDFEGEDGISSKTKKKPPRLTRPKSSSSQSNASSPSSSPSANVKSMNAVNNRKLLLATSGPVATSGRKQQKEISNKAIKSSGDFNKAATNGSPNNNKRKSNNKRSQIKDKGINKRAVKSFIVDSFFRMKF